MRFSSDYPKGYYELNPFPGCNQLVVSNHAFITPDQRGKGLGHVQHRMRLDKCKELGYNYVICTVHGVNMAEIAILEKAGWKHLDSFYNSETTYGIRIYGRVIQ